MKEKIKQNKQLVSGVLAVTILVILCLMKILNSMANVTVEDRFTKAFPHAVSIFEMTDEQDQLQAELVQNKGEGLNRQQQITLVDNMAIVEEAKYRIYDEEDTVSIGKYYKGAGQVIEVLVLEDSIIYTLRTDKGNIVYLQDISDVRAMRDILPHSYIDFKAEGWGGAEYQGVQIPKLLVQSLEVTKK